MKTWMWVVIVIVALALLAGGYYLYTQSTPESTPQPDVAPEPSPERRMMSEDSSLEEIVNQF